MGITRIADVTGLDTLGVPVIMVIRPSARSISVSQGKGLTLAAARASGVMESIEHWHAEHIQLPLKLGTVNELRFRHRLVDVRGLPRLSVNDLHDNLRLFWVAGLDLMAGGPTWVPFEVVHTDYALPLLAASGAFVMSSSGLASGNHPLEAVSHAICELIERDATPPLSFACQASTRSAALGSTSPQWTTQAAARSWTGWSVRTSSPLSRRSPPTSASRPSPVPSSIASPTRTGRSRP
jgi:YcaO-like protein with predicted kinase domain